MSSTKSPTGNESEIKGSRSILIVDDNPDNLRLLAGILTDKGYKVRPAHSGALALQSIRSTLPDLVLLDIKMPEMDGYEVCRRLKAEERTSGIPVIFISALGEMVDKIKGFGVGAVDYITKPFQHEEVLARVRIHMELRRLQIQLEQAYEEMEERVRQRTADLAQANEALGESEERYRELADSLPQIVFEMDEKGILTFANRNAFDIFGYTRSEFDKDLNAFDMLIAEDHDRALKNMGREFKGTSLGGSEYTAVTKDGDTFPVVLHATPIWQDNIPVGLRGIMIDLTKQKKMEADIRRRALAMDHSSDTIVITDTSGTITYVNPAFEKITGYTREEAIGENPSVLKSGKQSKSFYNHLWQTISGGKTWTGQLVNKKKDGSHYTEEATISPIFSSSGEIVNYVAVKRDITDRKRAEEELKRSLKNLEKAMMGTIQAITLTVERRDPYTAGHQRRVSDLAVAIATEMGLSKDQVEGIRTTGVIHDLGKVAVPAEILSKPGKITEHEFGIIKSHPQVGFEILKEIEFPWPIAQIVLQHHERMDGSGYPQGLAGEDILLEARIMAVADVVEAMSSHRPYRPAVGIDKALEEIEQNKGALYDRKVVDACLKIFKENKFEFE